jgi:GNAT superfamily N-acetyltransferase
MNTTIRRAALGDERALTELNAFVHGFHVANNPSHYKPASPDEVAAWFRDLFGNRAARIWIAEEARIPVGYASVSLRERAENPFCLARRWFDIDQIAVRPDRQRHGIGRALVQHVLAEARAEGIREVELTCWCFNPGAQEAFQRLGFAPTLTQFSLQVD